MKVVHLGGYPPGGVRVGMPEVFGWPIDQWGVARPYARRGDVLHFAATPGWALKEVGVGVRRAPISSGAWTHK